MADPLIKKPLDRDKPFKRINNQNFLVKNAPDGLGVPCGCHTPEEFGPVEKEFIKFLEDNLPVIGPLLSALETARKIAKTIADAATILKTALLTAPIIALLVAPLGLGAVLAVLGSVATIAGAIASIIGDVLDAIETALKAFFGTIGAKIFRRAVRVIPQWVPVKKGEANNRITASQVIEMEGTVTRSYGNPVEAPFFQWHRWFNWNVQVNPEPEYAKALSPANDPPDTTDFQATETPLNKNNSFEIQWDPGAMMTPEEAQAFEVGFKPGEIPAHDGPMLIDDWCWPTTGMFVWAAGRWVYDCSRVTTDANPKMCAMINPCKAIASARWKAVRFADQAHDFSVPAIQFLFFASKRGGYLDYEKINDEDYEFILDLPPAPIEERAPFPIAHTGKIPHNTIVLRPRLLRNVRQLFQSGVPRIEPIIEFIPPDDPKKPPTQVKVTVPLKSVDANARACGFVLSLGWFDPNLELAAKVKSCNLVISGFSGRLQVRDSGIKKIREVFAKEEARMREELLKKVDDIVIPLPIPFLKLHVGDLPPVKALVHKMVNAGIDEFFAALGKTFSETEEWLFRFGVNGVWKSVFIDGVKNSAVSFSPQIQFENILLGEDDFLFFSAHGIEFDPVGDMMLAEHAKRIITDNKVEIPWPLIVTPDADPAKAKIKLRDMAFQYVLKVLSGTTKDSLALGLDNSPLGIIDPDITKKGTAQDSNPLLMRGLGEQTFQIRRTAKFARAVGEQFILAEDSAKDDYTINYILQIRNQIK